MIQAILEVAVAAVVALVAEALLTQKEGAMYAVGAEVQLAVGVGAEGFLPFSCSPYSWLLAYDLRVIDQLSCSNSSRGKVARRSRSRSKSVSSPPRSRSKAHSASR